MFWARGKELNTYPVCIFRMQWPSFDVDLHGQIHSQHFLGKRDCNFELDWISVHPVKRQRYGILLPFLEEMTPNVLWQYIRRNMECTDPRVQLHKLCTVKSKHASAPRIKKGREDPLSCDPSLSLGNCKAKKMLNTSESAWFSSHFSSLETRHAICPPSSKWSHPLIRLRAPNTKKSGHSNHKRQTNRPCTQNAEQHMIHMFSKHFVPFRAHLSWR